MVLARTNKELEVFRLQGGGSWFGQYEGSQPFDSLLVQQVLALFRLADHSTDELAHYLATLIFPSVAARASWSPADPVESISTQNRAATRRQTRCTSVASWWPAGPLD